MPGPFLQIEQCKSRMFTYNGYAKSLSTKLLDFYETRMFCDITLIAGADDFRLEAHRMILAASSGYFEEMFRSNVNNSNLTEVRLDDWNEELLKMIVNFMYKPEIELKKDTVEIVLLAAYSFQMNPLVDACCTFMGDQMDIHSCLKLMYFAEQYNFAELYNRALEYSCNYFELVCKGPEFLELTADKLSRFLASDCISVRSEKSVLLCLLAWINHDKENRESVGFDLFQYIRFPLLNPGYIMNNMRKIYKKGEWKTLMMDWLRYIWSPESRSQFPSANNTPRRKYKKYKPTAGLRPEDYDEVHFYQCLKKRQKLSHDDSSEFHLGPRVGYLHGVGADFNNFVESYDPSVGDWEDRLPLSVGQSRVMITSIDGKYAVSSFSRAVEEYDSTTDKWTPLIADPNNCTQVITIGR